MSSKFYSLFLNTQDASQTAGFGIVDKSNLANVRYTVNWNSLLRNNLLIRPTSKVRSRVQFISKTSAAFTHNVGMGTIRIGLGNSTQVGSPSGTILTTILPIVSVNGAGVYYLYADTTSSSGVEINLPIANNEFTVGIYGNDGQLIANMVDYILLISFEIEEDQIL